MTKTLLILNILLVGTLGVQPNQIGSQPGEDMSRERARYFIKKHEGLRLLPYEDTTGNLTIGYGHNLDKHGITKEMAERLLDIDLLMAYKSVKRALPYWIELNEARKVVLVDMCFNMGIERLLGFKKMLAAIKERNFDSAADSMLNSLWAKQTKGRAVELAKIMREGRY